MKLRKTFIIVCCSTTLFAACKKTEDKNDDNNNNSSSTIRQTLLGGKWQEIAQTVTVNYMGKDTSMDMHAQLKECEKDDFVTFADNGITTKDENTNVCAGNPQTVGFPWALLNNDTKLALVDNNPDTFDLVINNTQMKLKKINKNSSGDPVTWLITLKNIK